MNKRKPAKTLILAGFFFCAISNAFADTAVVCTDSMHEQDGTQTELNACAASRFMKDDATLNRLYTKQLAALKEPEI